MYWQDANSKYKINKITLFIVTIMLTHDNDHFANNLVS